MINESSDFDWTSHDEQLSDDYKKNEMDSSVTHMASSTDKVDQRLINLYIYQKAHL